MAKSASFLPPRPADRDTIASHCEDGDFARAYPAVYSLLCTALRDGAPRKGSRLTLFAEDGRLKVAISDEDTQQTFWATLQGHEDVLGQIDRLLQEGRGEWRRRAPDRYSQGRR